MVINSFESRSQTREVCLNGCSRVSSTPRADQRGTEAAVALKAARRPRPASTPHPLPPPRQHPSAKHPPPHIFIRSIPLSEYRQFDRKELGILPNSREFHERARKFKRCLREIHSIGVMFCSLVCLVCGMANVDYFNIFPIQ